MAEPKGGYFGKMLEVDLTAGKSTVRALDEAVLRDYIGGEGLGAYLLYKELPAKADPLSPANVFMMLTGPFNGTACPSARLNVSFKSPHTGIYGHSQVGGPIGNEIKWAGWDVVMLKGKSPKPVYIAIHNDKVEIRDASAVWGKDTYATEEFMKEDLKDDEYKTMVIGPAGEKQVYFSCIIVDRFRAAGRSGGGAVLGSKNVKGIAVKGTKAVPVVNVEAFNKAAKEAWDLGHNVEAWAGIKRWGTGGLMEFANYVSGSLVTKNYSTSWFADVNMIGGEEASRTFWKRHVSCPNCPIHCMKLGVVRTGGNYDGLIAEGPEYETGVMMGSNLGISDLDACMKGIETCDAMGLDTISTGNTIGFAMELMERGILTPADHDGMKLEWGNAETAIEMVNKIANKEGKAGALLSLGVKRMAEKIGKDSIKYAIHVKGQELAAHDPRGFKPRGVSYAMGQLGGCHHEGNSPEGQAIWAYLSSMVLCSFMAGVPWSKRNPGIVCDMLNPLTGWNTTPDEYWATAKRIITIMRSFNIREAGISRKDDVLPVRLRTEALPEGPKKGAVFTDEDTKKMQDDYYAYYGWDENGIPTEETLKKLKLDFTVADVRKKA
ncbi:MAG: aldehyde ferredoxin oxidoreductase family protein [Desulfobacteraceae bacterium]|nr:aldehyde ferredoxin oxidoreductase family protein [Desulfobacteraceae bacterium]